MSRFVRKRQDDATYAGYWTVSKANLSGGYYWDFKYDDPTQKLPWDLSNGPDSTDMIALYIGADGWEPEVKAGVK